MRRWVTQDDFTELYLKIRQRGGRYILSKVNPNALKRTQSTFGESSFQHANWWIIPAVRRRWNMLITGNPNLPYEDYTVQQYLQGRQNLRMLSLGCGIGSHERHFAGYADLFAQIDAFDLAGNLIDRANELARQEGLENIRFYTADVNSMELEETYDVVLFHSSLHHFIHLEQLIGKKIPQLLKPEGLLVLNDYWGPNRLQWTIAQLKMINQLLAGIPKQYRTRFQSRLIKKKVTGPGILRMLVSDPSEAAEAERIQPLLRKYYTALEEKKVGGSILMPLLKDISHHFADDREETNAILDRLFSAEDVFLETQPSLLFFGVYRPQ